MFSHQISIVETYDIVQILAKVMFTLQKIAEVLKIAKVMFTLQKIAEVHGATAFEILQRTLLVRIASSSTGTDRTECSYMLV